MPNVASCEREIQDRLHAVGAEGMLGDPHAPNQHGILRIADEFCKSAHGVAAEPGGTLKRLPIHCGYMPGKRIESGGVLLDEIMVHPAFGEEDLHHAGEEGDVAALGDGEKVVGDLRAEQGGIGIGGDPILFHARLKVGIHENNFGAEFFGFVEVLGGNWLVVGRI